MNERSPIHVTWRCERCTAGGTLPLLGDVTATSRTVLDAVARGHQRRSPGCHQIRGAGRVLVSHNGKRWRFTALTPPSAQRSEVSAKS